jgi:hypothetical protein
MTLEEAYALPDGRYDNVPESVYHAMTGYCSSTYLRKLIINPAEAQLEFGEETAAMALGSAIHSLVLEGEDALRERFIFLPEDAPKKVSDRSRDAAKPSPSTLKAIEWWDHFEMEADGRTILSADDEVTITNCAIEVFKHPWAGRLLRSTMGQPEISIIWTDPPTGIRCKARVDRYHDKLKAPVDLKSTADARMRGIMSSINKYKYVVQFGHYINGMLISGMEAETYIAAFCQTKPPYLVQCGQIAPEKLVSGSQRASWALQIEAECRQMKSYPNIELYPEMSSLFEVYNEDGTIKDANPLLLVFDPYEYGI